MLAFVVSAFVLAIVALAYVFAPVLRHRTASSALLMAALLVATAGLYVLVGTPKALDPAQREAPTTLADATARLEQELRRDPGQAEGWRLLAEAYKAQGRLRDAATAYARAVEFQPKDPDLLTQAAEARALATADRRFDAAAVALLRQALATDPTHQRASLFMGVAQRQAGRPADAARTWEALLERVDARTGAALRIQINEARGAAGLSPLPAAASQARSTAGVMVQVDIAPTLRERLPANTTVFVLARVPGGPPMPVAVRRLALSELPASVQLGDADSLMPTRRLSEVKRVEVLARASGSGTANAASGDAESLPVAIDIGGTARLTIDRVRP